MYKTIAKFRNWIFLRRIIEKVITAINIFDNLNSHPTQKKKNQQYLQDKKANFSIPQATEKDNCCRNKSSREKKSFVLQKDIVFIYILQQALQNNIIFFFKSEASYNLFCWKVRKVLPILESSLKSLTIHQQIWSLYKFLTLSKSMPKKSDHDFKDKKPFVSAYYRPKKSYFCRTPAF